MRIFIGVDSRSPISAQILMHSIYTRASKPVQITPLILSQLPIKRRGLTDFTYSRYLAPYLCGYEGDSLFMDSDMLVVDDVWKLQEICSKQGAAVCVVKNKMRFEWPSLMYFNNSKCADLTPKYVEEQSPQSFHWATSIGEIPSEWNHLVGYDPLRDDAKLIHYTAGIPLFEETKGCEYSKEYHDELQKSASSVSWQELMGTSVHVERVKRGMAL